jgi:hypothetical protein
MLNAAKLSSDGLSLIEKKQKADSLSRACGIGMTWSGAFSAAC